METNELVRALAYLAALDRYSIAEEYAAHLPHFIDAFEVLRAADGAKQLARALVALRQQPAA